jgi:3D (Asp-Asp-Asp) domain-containing protein
MPKLRNIGGWVRGREGWQLGLLAALLVILAAGRLAYPSTVEIAVDGHTQLLQTCAATVSEALTQAGVTIETGDQVVPSPATRLRRGMRIEVERGVPITFLVGGKPIEMVVSPHQAKELAGGAALGPTTMLKLTRMTTRSEIEDVILPYQEQRKVDYRLPAGTTKIAQTGRNGLARRVTLVTEEDGKDAERKVIDVVVVAQPQNKVVLVGGQPIVRRTVPHSDQAAFSPKAEMIMEATAYTHTGNRTATGIYPYVGVVAVDPRVIPLGSELFVEGYGPALAADTGGLIKGNIIDVFLNTAEECLQWGRREVKVYLLEG